MKMPVVQSDLINTLGCQMQRPDYLDEVAKEFMKENTSLYSVVHSSLGVLYGRIDNERELEVAATVAHTTICLVYQALKQQAICDELENG